MRRELQPVEYDAEPLTPTRVAIGERTNRSVVNQPQFWLTVLGDATKLVEARQQLKLTAAPGSPVPTFNDFIIKITANVIQNYRRFNSWIEGEELRICRQINIGFAVATPEGVLIPTLFDADQKSVGQIAAEAAEMIDLARHGRLRASLTRNGTFTVSNIGPVGVDVFNAIISPPQTAILAVGTLAARPHVVDGAIEVRPTMYLTLSMDHRANDGADGAAFLVDIKTAVEGVTLEDVGG